MNITSPILTGAANAAELPGDSVTSFLRALGPAPACSATARTAALA